MPDVNNVKKPLILILGAIVLIVFVFAKIYYGQINRSIDPRVIEARELYGKYDQYAEKNDFKAIFLLLDSVETIYQSIIHYKHSYEVGVIYNNRSAAYLAMAIFHESNSLSLDGINILSKDSLLYLAQHEAQNSINIYTKWLNVFDKKSEDEIKAIIIPSFKPGLASYEPKEQERFLSNRVKEITEAQLETPRRLSVAYTNLGIINRHLENYELAIKHYKKAIELWDRNLAAENSLNVLLGQPQKKRNFIEKLLPPSKDK